MSPLPPFLVALAGLVVGAACGFAVRRARLCSFAALESALIGHDWRRMRVFGLALALALALTQALVAAGWLQPEETAFLPDRVAVLANLFGGALFGLGMALVGTCAFGSLLRLGGGDLRSLVVILVYAGLAYAAMRGVLAPLRLYAESFVVATPGGEAASLIDVLGAAVGRDLRLWLTLALSGALLAAFLADARLRAMPRMIAAGVTLGLGVAAGWAVTAAADDFDAARRITSLTFVAPVARAVYGGMIDPAIWLDFGVGTVFGAPLGALASARLNDDFRWEAFDDPREMRRHLLGAALMGVGGLLAGGCTIGQGLSAGSLAALSWPFALLGMAAGARLGMAILVEGTLREVVAERVARWRGRDDREA